MPGGVDEPKVSDGVETMVGDVVTIIFADVGWDLDTAVIFCTRIGVPACDVPTNVAYWKCFEEKIIF